MICLVILTDHGGLGLAGLFLEDRDLQQPLEKRTSERLKTIQGLATLSPSSKPNKPQG